MLVSCIYRGSGELGNGSLSKYVYMHRAVLAVHG